MLMGRCLILFDDMAKMSLDLKTESWHNSGGAIVMILVQKSLLLSIIITPSEYVHLDKRHIWLFDMLFVYMFVQYVFESITLQ